jgi:hypothetical protein
MTESYQHKLEENELAEGGPQEEEEAMESLFKSRDAEAHQQGRWMAVTWRQ